jgi:DNA-binding CsgD family transcriptional regulator
MGRAAERAAVDAFLSAVTGGSQTLSVLGEIGVGKSTLWRHAVHRGRELGYEVLRCTPAEADSRSSFAGLGDLLERLDPALFTGLPQPQRYALEVALLRREATDAPPERRTVAVAVTAVVRALAEQRPVLLAVDDAHWLDEPTAGVLEHLGRRLTTERVGVLACRRTEPGPATPPYPCPAPPAHRTTTLLLGPLELPALHRLVRARTGLTLARPLLLRVHAASGGNPFFALQIAAALQRSAGHLAPGEPLPLPQSLQGLVGERIGELPERTREALLYAAALSHPTGELVRAAVGVAPFAVSGLAEGELRGIIEIRHDRIRFTHPLFASTVYAAAPAEVRRAAHRRLAQVVTDPEQRAWQLALATAAPDAGVADSLAAAAGLAERRGAPGTAAELWELAAQRTPGDAAPAAHRRRAAAAACHFSAGDAARARTMLQQAAPALPPGPERVRALVKLAEIVSDEGDGARRAVQLCTEGLAETGDDDLLTVELLARRGWFATHDAPEQERSLDAALEIIAAGRVRPDRDLHACVLAAAAMYRFVNGGPIAHEWIARARTLVDPQSRTWPARAARTCLGLWAKVLDPADARTLFEAENALARQHGDELVLGRTHMHLAEVEFRLGDWPAARRHAATSREIMEQTGRRRWLGLALYAQAQVDGYAGQVGTARAVAAQGLEVAAEVGDPCVAALHHQALGGIALGLGELETADGHLSAAAGLVWQTGMVEPARFTFQPDQVEVAIGLGRLDTAAEQLGWLDRRIAVAPRPWLIAAAERCRAALQAALGDLDAAAEAVAAARQACAELRMPFELARVRLVEGRICRARRRKLAAREALTAARGLFTDVGAPAWAAQADAELRRCGLRRSSPAELTPTEDRVASLVAGGLTNREVAAIAYISVKTVEANLSRIYRKLGVRNRRELARAVVRPAGGTPPATT